MPKFYVKYRDEFGAEVAAKNLREAIEKFKSGKCKIEVISDLWTEFFEVTDKDGVVLQEMGWPELQSR